jgi:RimJ/RimL family protein N-acetyltransferase
VLERFAALKQVDTQQAWAAVTRPLADGRGSLAPACALHAGDAGLIERLAQIRERNMAVYPTQFTVTRDGTERWFRELVLAAADRIMFLVLDGDERIVGHLGFAHASAADGSLKLDNVMGAGAPKGLMSAALRELLDWSDAELEPAHVWVNPFADNERAVGFFEQHGFRPEGLIPLERRAGDGRIDYVRLPESQAASADRFQRLLIRDRPAGA